MESCIGMIKAAIRDWPITLMFVLFIPLLIGAFKLDRSEAGNTSLSQVAKRGLALGMIVGTIVMGVYAIVLYSYLAVPVSCSTCEHRFSISRHFPDDDGSYSCPFCKTHLALSPPFWR